MHDSFSVRRTLSVNNKNYTYLSLPALSEGMDVSRLPFSLKILLENLLRHEDGVDITRSDIEALANWDAQAKPETEIAFTPSREYFRISPVYRQWLIWLLCVMQ